MVLVWGVFIFAKVRFASFAVVGPFTNGPCGVAVLVFSDGVVGWRSFCGVLWWMGEAFWSCLPGHPLLAFGFAPPCVFDEGGGGPAL